MRSLTREDAAETSVRNQSVSMNTGVWGSSPFSFVCGMESWIRDQVRIVSEPEEILKRPALMVAEIRRWGFSYGDCDDVAMLAAALALAIGIGARFRAIQPQRDGSMGHVFAECHLGGGEWIPVDATLPHIPEFDPRESMVVVV